MAEKYLCYKDVNGFRGYVPPHTPYILRQISETHFWLETDSVTALIEAGEPEEEPEEGEECKHYTEVLGYVAKEENAMKWLLCEDDSMFIGANNCTKNKE